MVRTNTNEYVEYLIEEYSDMVYRLAISRTRNKEESEDIYQEVFLRLAKRVPEFESKEHEKAWLIRVTINCTKTLLGSKFKNNIEELKENIQFETEEKSSVYYAILELPLKYRTIIHLFYYEGYKIEEISKILNVNENTIKTRLSRARENLKNKMKGGLDDE